MKIMDTSFNLPNKYQSASQFQTRKEEPKRKWIDNL